MQEIQPSPLALLAATCSRIGNATHDQQQDLQHPQQINGATSGVVVNQLGGPQGQQQSQQIRILNAALLQQLQAAQQQQQQQADGNQSTVAGHQQQLTRDPVSRDPLSLPSPSVQQQPQVITLSQLQNFLPLHQGGQHHVTAVASAENNVHGQQQQQQTTQQQGSPAVKTFPSSAVTPTVVSVQGVPGQFIQVTTPPLHDSFHTSHFTTNVIRMFLCVICRTGR